MEKLKKLVECIDALTDKTGRLFSFLFIPLMIISFTEFILRYFFNSPTIWAWDINIQLFGMLILFGGAYAHYHKMHVHVDLFVLLFSRRVQAILALISSTLLFFTLIILLILTTQEAWDSFGFRERVSSVWAPPIYPLKMMIPLAIVLFILQGVAQVIRNVLVIVKPEGSK